MMFQISTSAVNHTDTASGFSVDGKFLSIMRVLASSITISSKVINISDYLNQKFQIRALIKD